MTANITFTGRIASGDLLLDTDLRDLQVVSGPGGVMLYAATGLSGGVSGFALGSGEAVFAGATYYRFAETGMSGVTPLRIGGEMQLMLEDAGAGRLVRYRPDEGAPGNAGTIDLPGRGSETPAALAGRTLKGGGSAIFMAEAGTGKIRAYAADETGKIGGTAALKGRAEAFRLEGEATLETARGGRVLLAADEDGLHSYRVNAKTGALTAADRLGPGEGLGVAGPSDIATVQAHKGAWAVMASAGSSSLSVMKVTAKGKLKPVDHAIDTLDTRFAGVTTVDVVKAGGHVLVAAGGADDGVSLFELLPNGRLLHLDTLVHETGSGLANVTALEMRAVSGGVEIFAASGTEAGIATLRLDLADLGRVAVQKTGAASGGAGNDILVASEAGERLMGGAGADIFALRSSETVIRISDFEPGTDRLDFTAFPMLRSAAQVKLRELDNGDLMLRIGTTKVRVTGADGELEASDIWGGAFSGADHFAFPEGPVVRVIEGTARSERLAGGSSDDTVRARGGDDALLGRDGADRLQGGSGHDRIEGGGGRDRLMGNGGRDRLEGQAGHDRLSGGTGADTLLGGAGRDRIAGGRGDDRMKGGAGADEFRFAKRHGDDRIVDFDPDKDVLAFSLRRLGLDDLDISRQGRDTLIDTGHGTITLDDVLPRALDAGCFDFG